MRTFVLIFTYLCSPALIADNNFCIQLSGEELTSSVLSNYESADIVALIGDAELTDTLTTRHKVIRVWKGSIGEIVYVERWPSYALLFATRSEPNGPLRPLGGLCDIGANTNVVIDIVRARFGAGYLPQPGHKENQFNQSFVHWPLLFGFLFLAIGCVLINELIKIVAKDKWHQK